MWTGEIVFSEGDLCNVEEYLRYLSEFSFPSCDLYSRQSHVQAMIKRLESENELLNHLIISSLEV